MFCNVAALTAHSAWGPLQRVSFVCVVAPLLLNGLGLLAPLLAINWFENVSGRRAATGVPLLGPTPLARPVLAATCGRSCAAQPSRGFHLGRPDDGIKNPSEIAECRWHWFMRIDNGVCIAPPLVPQHYEGLQRMIVVVSSACRLMQNLGGLPWAIHRTPKQGGCASAFRAWGVTAGR